MFQSIKPGRRDLPAIGGRGGSSLSNPSCTRQDDRLGYPRTECHCARCLGHQGHIFHEPTGLRYGDDGVALRFVPA